MNRKFFILIFLFVCLLTLAVIFFNSDFFIDNYNAEKVVSETENLNFIEDNWRAIQAEIPFRPNFHNQFADEEGIWRGPTAIQFLKDNVAIIRFEDDNNVHLAVAEINHGSVIFKETFINRADFEFSDWQGLVEKYGHSDFEVVTYAIDLVRDREIVSFDSLTKVDENVFLRNYWNN